MTVAYERGSVTAGVTGAGCRGPSAVESNVPRTLSHGPEKSLSPKTRPQQSTATHASLQVLRKVVYCNSAFTTSGHLH